MFFVSEKKIKKYSRISRIFKLQFFLADVALIITHTLCHFISMQMISTSTISTFAFLKSNFKDNKQKINGIEIIISF